MSDHVPDGQDARSLVGEFVAPGRLVTVNGHRVHYVETGSGRPTVVGPGALWTRFYRHEMQRLVRALLLLAIGKSVVRNGGR
jgi:hypothetical protein